MPYYDYKSYEDQAGVEWTDEELDDCVQSGQASATCPRCGHWAYVGIRDAADCPRCGEEGGHTSPLVQFGRV